MAFGVAAALLSEGSLDGVAILDLEPVPQFPAALEGVVASLALELVPEGVTLRELHAESEGWKEELPAPIEEDEAVLTFLGVPVHLALL